MYCGIFNYPTLKRFLFLSGITAIFVHFTFIIFFCFPDYFGNSYLFNFSKKYTFPLFSQNWQLFAPEPPMAKHQLFYKCIFSDNSKSAWIKPAASKSFQRELAYAIAEINQSIRNENDETKQISEVRNKKLKERPEFKKACGFFTAQALKKFVNKKPETILIMYITSRLPSIKNKAGTGSTEVIVFPEVNIP